MSADQPKAVRQFWRVVREKTEYHWLELEGWDDLNNEPDPSWHAAVRWDECVHLNFESGLMDYLHVCSVSELIARLEELRVHAREHFGAAWDTPLAWWKQVRPPS